MCFIPLISGKKNEGKSYSILFEVLWSGETITAWHDGSSIGLFKCFLLAGTKNWSRLKEWQIQRKGKGKPIFPLQST